MSVKTVQAIINGQTHTLTYNDGTGKYEATITAPATSSYPQEGHYYPVQIKAEDDAGNVTTVDDKHSTLGESLRLKVVEKVAPTITITSPTQGAFLDNSTPTITFKVEDNDSGVAESTIKLTIDDSEYTTEVVKSPVEGGYECSYTPTVALGDGEHTITVNASDNDGNAATAQSVTITVDTVPPTLSITAPAEGLVTNTAELTVTGTTNDATSKPVTVTINGEPVTVETDGSFSKAITLTPGANQITVIATDKAGKSTTVTRNVTLDTGAPVIQSVSIVPNPVDAGATYIISVEVTD